MSVGLVLEGGGTRGAYTSGVLDVFLKEGIEFQSIYGVSAGACNAMSYLSKQYRRNFNIFYQYINDERYLSVTSLYKTGSIFGFGFIFGELSHELLPFDYQTFFHSPVSFHIGCTNVVTGRPVFFEKEDLRETMDVMRASASLPMMAPIVEYKGYRLLDGGVSDPIPVERSILDGNRKNVLVLTRDISYRKRAKPEIPRPVLRAVYRDYPNLVECMLRRPEVYNKQAEVCRHLEQSGQAVVIRPSSPVMVGRYEKDREKLADLYEMGVKDAYQKLDQIQRFLQEA